MTHRRLLNNLWVILVILVIPTNSIPCCCWSCFNSGRSSGSSRAAWIATVRPAVYPPSIVEYCDTVEQPDTGSSQELLVQRSGIGSLLKKLKPGKSSPASTSKPNASKIPVRTPGQATSSTKKTKKRRMKRILNAGSTGLSAVQMAMDGVETAMKIMDLKDEVQGRLMQMKGAKTTATEAPLKEEAGSKRKVLVKRPLSTTSKPEYEYYYVYEDEDAGVKTGTGAAKS